MYIGQDAFSLLATSDEAKKLFEKSVTRVELETHSYCNRRCDYCPNVIGDRLGDNKRMPEHLWQMVIDNLAEIGYTHNLVFTSYNEPLADRIIIDRVKQARERLPKANLMIYSNGDYLDSDYLNLLSDAGLDYLHISIHTRPGAKYAEVPALNNIFKLGRRIRLPLNFKALEPGEFITAVIPHPKIKIDVRAINYLQHGTDRGGLVTAGRKIQERTLPCYFPFAHFHVGFEGTVVPCCHIRSDNEAHAAYRYGSLETFGSIFAAYASRAATEWRRELISPEPKKSPCDTCTVGFLSEKPEILSQVKHTWLTKVKTRPLAPG